MNFLLWLLFSFIGVIALAVIIESLSGKYEIIKKDDKEEKCLTIKKSGN